MQIERKHCASRASTVINALFDGSIYLFKTDSASKFENQRINYR